MPFYPIRKKLLELPKSYWLINGFFLSFNYYVYVFMRLLKKVLSSLFSLLAWIIHKFAGTLIFADCLLVVFVMLSVVEACITTHHTSTTLSVTTSIVCLFVQAGDQRMTQRITF